MSKFKSYILYPIFILFGSSVINLPAFAHTEGDNWGHHMAGGPWGWGPMVLFWIAGVLLIVLLTVTVLKTLRDS